MATDNEFKGVATHIFVDDMGRTHCRYHQTDVVVFSSEYVVLHSGGWDTATTLRRMNQASRQFFLGYEVRREGGKWIVRNGGEDLPFHDGMMFRRLS